MNLILDTHLLIWAAGDPERLSTDAMRFLGNRASDLYFSAASIWEVAIKSTLSRDDFHVVPSQLREGLVQHDYTEIPIRSEHAIAVGLLPNIHNDPFDRMLVAQAQEERLTLLTTDKKIARYPGPIQLV